jgi:hypothetical protein
VRVPGRVELVLLVQANARVPTEAHDQSDPNLGQSMGTKKCRTEREATFTKAKRKECACSNPAIYEPTTGVLLFS